MSAAPKRGLGSFLRSNPYPRPWTDGLFFREKMRAIHRVCPDAVSGVVLDVGAGGAGLARLLYPDARVVEIDVARPDRPVPATSRLVADATALPLATGAVALVLACDVLEHIVDDATAVAELQRVIAPGGTLVISTPSDRWRYPRAPFLRRRWSHEAELMAEWGHVRRGYAPDRLDDLVGRQATTATTFAGALTSPFHDIAFSPLPTAAKRTLHAALALPVAVGYAVETRWPRGNELVRSYRSDPER